MQLLKVFCFVIGYVFISSGIVKLFVRDFQEMFLHLGLPFPYMTLFLVAMIEIACGALVIARMYVKYATIPLIVIMIGALVIVKLPLLIKEGILSFVFESRLDFVMLILLIFLFFHHEKFNLKV